MDFQAPIRDTEELRALWQRLMGPWGYDEETLWLLIFDAKGVPRPGITKIEAPPPLPDRRALENLMSSLVAVVQDGSVAFLRSRPGTQVLTGFDTTWAAKLQVAACSVGLRTWPVHLATQGQVREITPDDFARSAS